MKPGTKKILNLLLILGTLLIVLLLGFNGANITESINAFRSSLPQWLLVCLLCYVLYVLTDSLSIWYFLKRQGAVISVPYAVFVSIEGMYYSGITPGATGGQPMQVFYLSKKKVPIGLGTSALVVKLFCFQFMLLVFGSVCWIRHADFINNALGGNRWILVTGFVYNAVIVGILMLVAVYKPIVRWLIRVVISLTTRLHLCKDPDSARAKWEDVVDTYHASIQILLRRPLDLVIQLGLSLLQLLAITSVTCFVFFALRQDHMNFSQVLAMSVMLYTSASYTPLPGASGAQEGFFSMFFSPVISNSGIMFPALLLWRFFTYYIWLIVGAVVSVVHGLRSGKNLKTALKNTGSDLPPAGESKKEQEG